MIMTIVLYSLIGLAILTYIIVGIAKASSGFSKPNKLANAASDNYTFNEKHISKCWDEYNRAPDYNKKPSVTLEEYYNYKLHGNDHYIDALRAEAYRRMLWCAVWPLLVVVDNYRKYKQFAEGERIYAIEKSTKELEKAKKYQDTLGAAKENAEKAIADFQKA